jgi:gluconokinase
MKRAVNGVVVMGVSGAGKSTLAQALARHLGWRFIEGDDLHPPANVAKMARGEPLDDEDRRPFLEAIAERLAAARPGAIAACSALKRQYRDLLRARAGELVFVQLQVPAAELARRLAARPHHFMPASLLVSQLATLEPLQADERGFVMDGAASLDELAARLAPWTHPG